MSFLNIVAVPFLAAAAYAADPPPASSSASSAASSASASGPTSTGPLPNLSSTSAATTNSPSSGGVTTDAGGATRTLPKLTGGAGQYTYPPPTVPPTANAPYMQKSSLPNGTVFICVGAALGFFFAVILGWRAWAAWMLHRRMNAANAQYTGVPTNAPSGTGSGRDRKLRKSGMYQRDMTSELSLDPLSKKEHGGRRRTHNPTDSGKRQSSNLFFSPTAGAGAHGSAQQRASSFLPAGYYAAGGSAIGSTTGNAMSTSDLSMRTGDRLSMADFGAPNRQSYGYKDSPLLGPQTGNGLEPPSLPFARNAGARNSVASLSGSETNSRAPSAYLEDLFDSTPVKERSSHEREEWR